MLGASALPPAPKPRAPRSSAGLRKPRGMAGQQAWNAATFLRDTTVPVSLIQLAQLAPKAREALAENTWQSKDSPVNTDEMPKDYRTRIAAQGAGEQMGGWRAGTEVALVREEGGERQSGRWGRGRGSYRRSKAQRDIQALREGGEAGWNHGGEAGEVGWT